jgi:hypothetical protein
VTPSPADPNLSMAYISQGAVHVQGGWTKHCRSERDASDPIQKRKSKRWCTVHPLSTKRTEVVYFRKTHSGLDDAVAQHEATNRDLTGLSEKDGR